METAVLGSTTARAVRESTIDSAVRESTRERAQGSGRVEWREAEGVKRGMGVGACE